MPRTPTSRSSATRRSGSRTRLAQVGARARELGIRLSTHPGQYTVLNSEDERVQRLAAEELEVQAEVMDGDGPRPEAVVVLHVGGPAGGKRRGAERFCAGSSSSPTAPARGW